MSALVPALGRLLGGASLDRDEARSVMRAIMAGEATPAQIGAYLVALRMKGETADEIAGSALAMREFATPVHADPDSLLDTCGTGGDGAGTINVSTGAALVAAAAGARVAKHGNRSVSSRSGSADVLEKLGVSLAASTDVMERCLSEIGIAFLFAPALHPAMKHAIGPRREIGQRTLMNLLGPLANPAAAKRQLLGVYDPALTETLAGVLAALGSTRAWVVHGDGGVDEIAPSGRTKVSELTESGEVRSFTVSPEDAGLPEHPLAAIRGGTPEENAESLRRVLAGEKGAARDAIVLNAAAGLLVAGIADDLADGARRAAGAIDEGRAAETLRALARATSGGGGDPPSPGAA